MKKVYWTVAFCLFLSACVLDSGSGKPGSTVPVPASATATPTPSAAVPSPSPSQTPYPFVGDIYGTGILAAEGTFDDDDFDLVRDSFMFFGHQSVGDNILNGLTELGSADGRYLVNSSYVSTWEQLSQWTPSAGHGSGGLGAHGVGTNYNPASKIASFTNYITTEDGNGETIGGNADIAFYKFCFVDIDETSDVEGLCDAYVAAMQALETSYPSTIFVYATIPLLTSESASNVKHNQYNALLRAFCAANGRPLFDIADLEAVNADGTRSTFVSDGVIYDKLSLEWSNGADPHLNAGGGRRIAKAMILMLADLLKKNA